VRWIEGDVPTVVDPGSDVELSRRSLALDLAAVVTALRNIEVPLSALTDPELRWYRGDPLGTQDERTHQAIEACTTITTSTSTSMR
jgi:hypothetical protein